MRLSDEEERLRIRPGLKLEHRKVVVDEQLVDPDEDIARHSESDLSGHLVPEGQRRVSDPRRPVDPRFVDLGDGDSEGRETLVHGVQQLGQLERLR